MIQEIDEWQEPTPLHAQPGAIVAILADAPIHEAMILLGVGTRLLICLAVIYLGIWISVRSNDGIAVLAALGCGGVIYGLLSPNKGGE